MNKIIILIIFLFNVSVVESTQFKVEGSAIYYKQDNAKSYNDLDFIIFSGITKSKLSKNGDPIYLYEDKSNIKKIIQNSYTKNLIIYKEKSIWMLDYKRILEGFPIIHMVYPDIKEYERDYIKQIYP